MASFCEIKLADPLDNSLLGEFLPSRRVFVDTLSFDVNLSILYSRADSDKKRKKRSKKKSILYNVNDYFPNYYVQDVVTTSKEEYDLAQKHSNTILPFSDNKEEEGKKLQTFNTSANNARFSGLIRKTLGTEGTVYFNNLEHEMFNDISFDQIPIKVIEDSFKFISDRSIKIESNLDYPYYVNNYSINKMGSAIYPFDVLEEIQLSLITIKNIKGIHSYFDKNDSRERNYQVADYVDGGSFSTSIVSSSRSVGLIKGLEPYSDDGAADLLISEEKSKTIAYTSSYDRFADKFVFTEDSANTTQSNTISQNFNYILEENNIIEPFREDESISDVLKVDNSERVNVDDEILELVASTQDRKNYLISPDYIRWMPHGSDINYEYSAGIESIAFKGLLD